MGAVQPKPNALVIAEAVARSGATLDAPAAYVLRGRQYADRSNDALRRAWVRAFRRWFNSESPAAADYTPVADLAAELSFRDEAPPYAEVEAELEQARDSAIKSDVLGQQIVQEMTKQNRDPSLARNAAVN